MSPCGLPLIATVLLLLACGGARGRVLRGPGEEQHEGASSRSLLGKDLATTVTTLTSTFAESSLSSPGREFPQTRQVAATGRFAPAQQAPTSYGYTWQSTSSGMNSPINTQVIDTTTWLAQRQQQQRAAPYAASSSVNSGYGGRWNGGH